MDTERNRTVGRIAVVPTDGSKPFAVWTSGSGNESDPQWSPDGSYLGFVSTREEKRSQVYRIPVDGGEAVPVTRLPEGSLLEWCWSPDASRLAVLFRPVDPAQAKEELERRSRENRSTPPRTIEKLRWRMEGSGFLTEEAVQLIVVDLATEEHRTLAVGGGRDVSGLAWSPSGDRVVLIHSIADDPDRSQSDDGFFLIDLADGSLDAVPAVRGPKGNPVFSPDGRSIAWLGHDGPDETWGVRNNGLWILDLDSGECRNVTADWDVHVGDCTLSELHGKGDVGPFWTPDGASLAVLVSDHGRTHVWKIGIDGSRALMDEDVSGFSMVGTERAILSVDADHPGDICFGGRRLAGVNDDLLAQIHLRKPLAISPEAPDGSPVPCFVLFPADFETVPAPRPTLVYIHGGPHLMYGEKHLFHEFQALAAAGYVVLFPNPRGSKGYGEAWTAAIRGDWGTPAMDDVMACVDFAVAQGWADPDRL
ncbi:MAG: S9 family peptidase, partial [Armatimonadaceae bacterium]